MSAPRGLAARVGPVTPRRVLRGLLTLGFAVVVLAFLLHTVPALGGAKASYVVLSGSMEPAIAPGDVVYVYGADPATVAVGDVVTYRRPGETIPITHRVIAAEGTGDARSFVTKGDANEDPDPGTVPASAVVGVVPAVDLPVLGETLFIAPLLGHLVLLVRTPLGFAALIGVPLVAVLGLELRDALAGRRGQIAADGADEGGAAGHTDADGPAFEYGVDAGSPLALPAGEAPVVAAGERTTSAAQPESDRGASATGDGVTLTPSDLTLTTAVLVVFAAYAVAMAVTLREAAPVAVAVAVAGAALLAAAVRYGGFGVEPAPEAASAPAEAPPEASPAADGGTESRPAAGTHQPAAVLPGIDRREWR